MHIVKKIVILNLIFILITSSVCFATEEVNEITIMVNGEEVAFENPPVIIEKRTIAPLRAVFEQLGLEVSWDGENKSVTGTSDGINVWLQLNNKTAKVNGEDIELDVPAFLIENRMYVPVRFLAESTSCVVGWINESKTVTIDSVINKESLESTKKIEDLKSKINYLYDEKLFLLFSFLNYTGYDEDNYDNFSDIRIKVRKKLDEKELNLINPNFFTHNESKTKSAREYFDWYENTEDLPSIKPINSSNFITELRTLDKNLREFYEEANINELYELFRDDYEAMMDLYRDDEVLAEIIQVLDFARVEIEDLDEFNIVVNPLISHETGHASLIDNKYFVTVGPYSNNEANIYNIIHEYLHTIINPIFEELPSNLRRKADNQNINQESFVVSLTAMFINDENERIDYIMGQDKRRKEEVDKVFFKFVDEYPDFEGTLEEFVQSVIKNINK